MVKARYFELIEILRMFVYKRIYLGLSRNVARVKSVYPCRYLRKGIKHVYYMKKKKVHTQILICQNHWSAPCRHANKSRAQSSIQPFPSILGNQPFDYNPGRFFLSIFYDLYIKFEANCDHKKRVRDTMLI